MLFQCNCSDCCIVFFIFHIHTMCLKQNQITNQVPFENYTFHFTTEFVKYLPEELVFNSSGCNKVWQLLCLSNNEGVTAYNFNVLVLPSEHSHGIDCNWFVINQFLCPSLIDCGCVIDREWEEYPVPILACISWWGKLPPNCFYACQQRHYTTQD